MDGDRFWSKVDMTKDCWLWTGAVRNGYGCWKVNGKATATHRTSWELEHGPIPDRLVIHNVCGNRLCVNPDHLRAITYKQNTAIALDKGTHHRFTPGDHARGESVHTSKLNARQVREIRKMYAQGLGYRRISMQFGVDRKNIQSIVKRITWRHV